MASGVTVNVDVQTRYNKMKLDKDCGYMMLKMTDNNTQVDVEKCGPKGCKYGVLLDELQTLLSANQCRYVICDFKPSADDVMQDGTLLLFIWSPDTANVTDKMLYASSISALKKSLGTGYKEVTARHDMSDVDIDELAAYCSKR